MDANAKLICGVDVIRDPRTGREYDVERVWLPEQVTTSKHIRGSASESCALHGGPPRGPRDKQAA